MYNVSIVRKCKQLEVEPKTLSFEGLYTLCLKCGNEVEGKDGLGLVPSQIIKGTGETNSTRGKTGHWRQAHLCQTTSLLCLDIEAHQLSDDKDKILEHIRLKIPGIKFIAWTTHSHGVREVAGKPKWTPNHPRLRVVVPLSRPVESFVKNAVSEYDGIFQWAASHFDGVDTKAKDPSRISYLPRKKSQKAELDPWIHFEKEGTTLDVECLPGDTSVKDEIERAETSQKSHNKAAVSYATERGLTEEQLRDALDHIKCYDDRDDWLKIGMALNHYSYVEGKVNSDIAFDLWDEWSQQSTSYGGTRNSWDSFSQVAKTNNEVTIGTVIFLARENGWQPPRKEFVFLQTDDAYISKRVVSDHYEQTVASQVSVQRIVGGWHPSPVQGPSSIAFPDQKDVKTTSPVWGLGSLWVWHRTESIWRKLPREEIITKVADYSGRPVATKKGAKPSHLNISAGKAKGVFDLIEARAATDFPDFFDDGYAGVQCQNAAIFESDDSIFILQGGHPWLKQRHRLPLEYDQQSRCPKFLEFLDTCFLNCADSEDRIKLLQEYTGALIFGRAWETQKILLLHGPGGGGKSQFIKVISALFDERDLASVSPQDMSDKYRPAQLVNARANIVADIDKKELLTTGLLKQITGTDRISVEPKYRDAFTVQIKCGHLFSCNKLPQTTDNSSGFWSRWHLCAFPHNFRGTDKEEKGIGKKIINTELAGILNWAIEGYERLVENDLKFTIPNSSELEKAKWKRDCDPVELFVHEVCEEVATPADGLTIDELYRHFQRWSADYGRGQGMAKNTFGEHLTSLDIGKKRVARNGSRDTYYSVKLRQDAKSSSGLAMLI